MPLLIAPSSSNRGLIPLFSICTSEVLKCSVSTLCPVGVTPRRSRNESFGRTECYEKYKVSHRVAHLLRHILGQTQSVPGVVRKRMATSRNDLHHYERNYTLMFYYLSNHHLSVNLSHVGFPRNDHFDFGKFI